MFKPVSNKVQFPQVEEETLSFWDDQSIFEKSLEQRKDSDEFVFYDGPPFATGLPHYGHLLAGTIKDIVPRYHAMRGHYVERRFGWDCHGLPIEALAQEALGLAGTAAIKEKGIDVFNEQCRSMVLTYVSEWEKTVRRMGRWVDFKNDYKTMDTPFMETIWWVFKQLWEQGRVYRDYRIMPYSWKLTTPLSNFEANSNYQDVQDPAITVRFKLLDADSSLPGDIPLYALAWTTTPWTLPENLALCAGPDIDYVIVKDAGTGDGYLLAEARLAAYYKKEEQYEVLHRLKGRDVEGWTYEPLFPYFADHPNSFRILNDEFVTTEDGTGLVHLAPAYGEDDYRVCKSVGIELVDPLDDEARFTGRLPEYEGQFCKDADKALISWLKQEGKLVHQGVIQHSYPFCERTDTPLIYRAIDAWYVRVEDLRDELSANNDTVHWVPQSVGEKRFGNWLKDAKDWNISRNRFWGSCIPVWINEEDPEDMICVGSIQELEELSGENITDLHKHRIDPVLIKKDGKTYRRTPEVLDCWFESGSMPYAQCHYPFENKERFESHFPADFIAEGLDQTRGWFYTLMILSTALFKRPAYKNVVVNGMVLAEDGRKMSKRLKNYPDPRYILDTYGADALRLNLMNSPVVRAEDLCFTEDGVKHSLRHLLIPWWNAYSFLVTYARIDNWTPEHKVDGTESLLDRWILSSMERLKEQVVDAMDAYDLQRAVRPFVQFIEDLTNWYIRRSRRRFWKSRDDEDKLQAYSTLYTVLLDLSKVAAPFVPFISDAIYRNLRTENMPESVHLCDYPQGTDAHRDPELEERMAQVMAIVGMGRTLRLDYNLKVRQPLKGIHVVCRDQAVLDGIKHLQEVIASELNVKEVWFNTNDVELADLKAKPNFKILGPRLGSKVKQAAGIIAGLSPELLHQLADGSEVGIELDGEAFTLHPDDVQIQREPKEGLAVQSEGALLVALEVDLTPELEQEGLAREIVNRVQNLRKSEDLDVSQRITLELSGDEVLREAFSVHQDYIQSETLCLSWSWSEVGPEAAELFDINGYSATIYLAPANA